MITTKKQQYVVDEGGRRTAVLLDIELYKKLLGAQEELEELRAFDNAKSSGNEEVIPFSQAISEIEEIPQ